MINAERVKTNDATSRILVLDKSCFQHFFCVLWVLELDRALFSSRPLYYNSIRALVWLPLLRTHQLSDRMGNNLSVFLMLFFCCSMET